MTDRIAIVGYGAVLPGAASPEEFWQTVRAGRCAIRPVPVGRWVTGSGDAVRGSGADQVACTHGGFLDRIPLPTGGWVHDIADVGRLDPVFHLALAVGRAAWDAAKVEPVDPRRVGVVLGNIALPTDGASAWAREILGPMIAGGPTGVPTTDPRNRFPTGLPAGLLAHALGLGGGSFTLDAACASSLYALKFACDELLSRRADAMIAGGISRPDCLYTQMGFTQLRALSPTGRCSPFDAAADGLIVGEGGAAFVLKRLDDAIDHGDAIHAVIAGIGLSNDRAGGLLAPASEGQLRAMRAAYDMAGWTPDSVGLIECHATGTPLGDAVEFAGLRQFWGTTHQRAVIGSVKSNVGHLLTGAGAAGVLKSLFALRDEVLPPTANFREPARAVELAGSPFRVLRECEDWPGDRPRRAANSAFGFGGINAHLLLERYRSVPERVPGGWPGERQPVAVVGVGVNYGPWRSRVEFERDVAAGVEPPPVEKPPLPRAGHYVDAITVEIGKYRIPPAEIAAMLPQQLLMLTAAAEAWDDAGLRATDRARVGAYVGLGMDAHTTDFHLRWALPAGSRDAAGPPLTPDRTMGALGSIAASRIARLLKLGGPTFALSSEETSGLRALRLAADAVGRGELDAAIVGGVDVAGELRTQLAADVDVPADGAVALVVMRLADAEQTGRPVYAVVDDMETTNAADVAPMTDAAPLMHVARECILLRRAVRGPAFWLTDGPRQSTVTAASRDGNGFHVCLSSSDINFKPFPERKPFPNLAFVYPGSGNHFVGMGRELAAAFPFVLKRQQAENVNLRSQYRPDLFWEADAPEADGRDALFGQVALGTLVTDLLRYCGVEPSAVIGNSLGESAGLFGMRAWRDRDEMARRLATSDLFTGQLAGSLRAVRAAWNMRDDEPLDWVTAVVPKDAAEIRPVIDPNGRARLLMATAPGECVIGGDRPAVEELCRRAGTAYHPLRGVTVAHCDAVRPVAEAYYRLHHLPTAPPPGVRFYGQAVCSDYAVSPDTAAESILRQACEEVDFVRLIERAYADGLRVFVEIGPGASCCRWIDRILGDRPHVTIAACPNVAEPVAHFRRVLERLEAEGVPVDWSPWNEPPPPAPPRGPTVTLPVPVLPFSWKPTMPPPSPSRNGRHAEFRDMPVSLVAAQAAASAAVASAQQAYLQLATATYGQFAAILNWQEHWLRRSLAVPEPPPPAAPAVFLNRDQCLTFAVGKIGDVLGERYAAIDAFPTRVRLPDEPLMLVDRIIEVEGEPLSLTRGRVVTEHDVTADRWYLDHGRIPTCVAVESGQADLFLAGYLGIDLHTRGLAVYRLLDAVVTFHRGLPGPGSVIRYDIHIERFFRQGDTILFRFHFESTVDGQPLLSMREGCAGFFTADELAAGKGIIHTELDRRPVPGKMPDGWSHPAPLSGVETFNDEQVRALRDGDLVAAFGPAFARLPLGRPSRLPGGLMTLVKRVPLFDPAGGRFGLGRIRGEADIRADDWHLTCHFVDDQVMPGTLMYECCLHTLRIFLTRCGWVDEADRVAWEPVPGVHSRLKCRGQVIASTTTVTYEVSVKEVGFGPEPFVIADALMYADGKPIVEITDMSARLVGSSRERFAEIWSRPRPLFDRDRILAFAVGKPSEAFGEPYRVFDSERVIARLPGPPYQFLDRIVEIRAEPWKMVAGGEVVAEYDVPPDGWYFDAGRQPTMPFAVLLEVALQPCGWLAAYVGSALTSDIDLSFRNLGGSAVQLAEVGRDAGTLSTKVKLSNVSTSGGMIIQHYTMDMWNHRGPVYQGTTYFGFFTKAALANQVGIRDIPIYQPPSGGERFPYPPEPPFPDKRLRMLDEIVSFRPDGGPHGYGYVRGVKRIDPGEWFFQAHFFQDPVWPGSLGLEAFQQLLMVAGSADGGPRPRPAGRAWRWANATTGPIAAK